MKHKTINIESIASNQQCRLDSKYHIFMNGAKKSAFNVESPVIPLREILKPIKIAKIGKGDLNEDKYLVNISDQEAGTGILNENNICLVDNIGSDKNLLSGCDIFASKLGMSRGYIYLCPNKDMEVIGSTEYIPYLLLDSPSRKLFYLFLLLNPKMLSAYACVETGKTPSHRRVNVDDLLKIQIPLVASQTIDSIIPRIKDNLKRISRLNSQILSTQSIIDDVFSREFGFDYAKFEELKTHKRFMVNVPAFANNPDLRFSAKFHREAGAFVMEQLQGITSKKIKHYLAEPIALGVSVSPSDFDESGSAYYVSMASIKTLEIELDDTQLLSDNYFNEKQSKTLKLGDIVIARSGVAIGKTALVKDEFDGVFADFTMRIRLSNYTPMFAYYYFRTKYFQYLIEVHKKGLQNQNIFPVVVREFPLPDIALAEQQRIVDKIKAEIEHQDTTKATIANLRGQIDAIIENALIRKSDEQDCRQDDNKSLLFE